MNEKTNLPASRKPTLQNMDFLKAWYPIVCFAMCLLLIISGCKKDSENATLPGADSSANLSLSSTPLALATTVSSPVNLKTANDFTILTETGITTTGVTAITGNIGTSPIAATAITGFGLIMATDNQSSHTPIVTGKVYASNYAAPTPSKMTTAIADMKTAFTTANGLTIPSPIVEKYAQKPVRMLAVEESLKALSLEGIQVVPSASKSPTMETLAMNVDFSTGTSSSKFYRSTSKATVQNV